jgi:LDH2 family malate/lactate/ureidoglycolate dehydrogenase
MVVYHRVAEKELYRFTVAIFQAAGCSAENAAIVADNLVQGELHGLGSHGVSRLLEPYVKRLQAGGINPNPRPRVVERSGSVAVVDGDNGPGAVVGRYAMELALELAREHRSGWVGVRHSSHFGAAFLYARLALPWGMIGFSATSAVPNVAPYGGREMALGTNPLCMAVPGGVRGPIILDMATTVVSRGKIQLAAIEGKPIPLGWAVDEHGRPTTDPRAVEKGRLLPLGGYKGYGLALMVEVLCSVLTGAAIGREIGPLFKDPSRPSNTGHFFGALDVGAFMPLEQFKARMDWLIASVKEMPTEEGFEEVLVPGEPEARAAARNRAEGIPLAEDVVTLFQEMASRLGVAPLVLQAGA